MNILTYKSLRSDSVEGQLDAVNPAEDELKADLQRLSDLVKPHPARDQLQKSYPFGESIRMNPDVSVVRTTDLRRDRSPSVSVLHQTSDRLHNVSVYQEQLGRIYNVATNL